LGREVAKDLEKGMLEGRTEEGIEEFEEENVSGSNMEGVGKGNIEALKKVWVLKDLKEGNVWD